MLDLQRRLSGKVINQTLETQNNKIYHFEKLREGLKVLVGMCLHFL